MNPHAPDEASAATSSPHRAPANEFGNDVDGVALPPLFEPWLMPEHYLRMREAKEGRGVASRWLGPSVYDISLPNRLGCSAMTVYLAHPPSGECRTGQACTGNVEEMKVKDLGKDTQLRPAVWRAEKSLRVPFKPNDVVAQLWRASSSGATDDLAMKTAVNQTRRDGSARAGDPLNRPEMSVSLLSRHESILAQVQLDGPLQMSYGELHFDDHRQYFWSKSPDGTCLELMDVIFRNRIATLHLATEPLRLELTGLPWARMPSNELYCHYPDCPLRPIFGFSFRCRECSIFGDEAFDMCEAHLPEVRAPSSRHANQHFVRQPRPWLAHDDLIHQTPLLGLRDLVLEREAQEIILASLAIILFSKGAVLWKAA